MAMLIKGLSNAGALPSLELTMRFAAQRQRLLAHDIANIDTPGFIQQDVSVAGFQETLDEAIQARRSGRAGGGLDWKQTRELRRDRRGELRLRPDGGGQGVLFHDRNNRDIVRLMQAMTETTQAFRAASDLYRAHKRILQNAIRERVG
jgi:flagellar basal-body rod protein FlgB